VPKISVNYSPNFSLPKRAKKKIKFIIIHYTGMKKESLAISRLCSSNSKVSAHYFIKKNGDVLNLVPDLYEAWHAGVSKWKKFKSLNKYSIGIEIQNSGHNHSYENFTIKQIDSVKKLLKYLIKIYKIDCKNVLGHSDIAPSRKKDPGEKFPWRHLSKSSLTHWYSISDSKIKKLRNLKVNLKDTNEFFENLYKYGYNKIRSSKINHKDKYLVKTFQRRFRQNLINGKIDKECLLISKYLLKS
jgi:N-acetylmuramoyl-L-alanine amidase